jgi:hypothetical protein
MQEKHMIVDRRIDEVWEGDKSLKRRDGLCKNIVIERA